MKDQQRTETFLTTELKTETTTKPFWDYITRSFLVPAVFPNYKK